MATTGVSRTISKAEGARILRRTGYSADFIQEVQDQLADPIDIDRDAPTLERYGITNEHLMDLMGGSP